MEPADFKESTSGRLVRGPMDYWAFVPDPLPPEVDLVHLINPLSSADRAVGLLSGIAGNLPNPHLFVRPLMRREAVLSSRIEGTQASLSDLLYFEAGNVGERDVPGVQEVANYVHALEYGLARLRELPLSLRLIREIHEKLMQGVRGEDKTPGEFRRSQNWIGPPGCTLMEATFVPPPVDEMNAALDRFEKYLHGSSDLPPLIRLALIHYQFEAIHPFLDGNGRIGRLLVTLLLCAEELLPQPLLYVSAYFEKHRDEYYRLLLEVSRRGAWNEWVRFFLSAIEEQSGDTIRRSDALLALKEEYRAKLQEARASALLLQLVDQLFTYPAINAKLASRVLGVTQRSAQLNIEKLVEAGILKEMTGRRRNRIYAAMEIIRILEE